MNSNQPTSSEANQPAKAGFFDGAAGVLMETAALGILKLIPASMMEKILAWVTPPFTEYLLKQSQNANLAEGERGIALILTVDTDKDGKPAAAAVTTTLLKGGALIVNPKPRDIININKRIGEIDFEKVKATFKRLIKAPDNQKDPIISELFSSEMLKKNA